MGFELSVKINVIDVTCLDGSTNSIADSNKSTIIIVSVSVACIFSVQSVRAERSLFSQGRKVARSFVKENLD